MLNSKSRGFPETLRWSSACVKWANAFNVRPVKSRSLGHCEVPALPARSLALGTPGRSKETWMLRLSVLPARKSRRSKERTSTNRNWSRQRDARNDNENWIHWSRNNGQSHGDESAEAGPFTRFI